MTYELLDPVLERLGVAGAEEIWLEERAGFSGVDAVTFVARSQSRFTYVDRPLAVQLRLDGAVWAGDVRRDPCAVA